MKRRIERNRWWDKGRGICLSLDSAYIEERHPAGNCTSFTISWSVKHFYTVESAKIRGIYYFVWERASFLSLCWSFIDSKNESIWYNTIWYCSPQTQLSPTLPQTQPWTLTPLCSESVLFSRFEFSWSHRKQTKLLFITWCFHIYVVSFSVNVTVFPQELFKTNSTTALECLSLKGTVCDI